MSGASLGKWGSEVRKEVGPPQNFGGGRSRAKATGGGGGGNGQGEQANKSSTGRSEAGLAGVNDAEAAIPR